MNRFTSGGALQKTTKGAWTEEEDEQLRAGVEAYGPRCIIFSFFAIYIHTRRAIRSRLNSETPLLPRWCKVAEMVLGRNSDRKSVLSLVYVRIGLRI